MNKCLHCYQSLEEGKDYHDNCSREFFGTVEPPKLEYSLSQMNEMAKRVVALSVAVPGVQPKLSLSLDKSKRKDPDSKLTVIGALGGQYILKPPSASYLDMPENEHVTMRMAESFGLRVTPSTLIRLGSGELSYITKRIDRRNSGEKIHMLDMYQITEAFDKYKSSMERVGKALNRYSNNTLLDKTYLFDLTLFSFITGNNDMHLKNFSMIESNAGWILAPAYDLLNVSIVLPQDDEELALSLGGKKKKFKREHFEFFGKDLGLTTKQIAGSFKRLIENKEKAHNWIKVSFLSREMKQAYLEILEERYQRLFAGEH